MSIGIRLQTFRNHNKLSVTQFANALNTSDKNIYNYERELFAPSFAFLSNLFSTYPRLNANWLLKDEGEMLLPPPDMVQEPLVAYQRRESLTDYLKMIEKVRWMEEEIRGLKADIQSLKEQL